jgi:hypothetical protein
MMRLSLLLVMSLAPRDQAPSDLENAGRVVLPGLDIYCQQTAPLFPETRKGALEM